MQIEERLQYESFAGLFGLWADRFKPFIESKDMFDIYQKLKTDAKKEIIVPNSDAVFRSFATSNPSNLKVVWYLMDPYPRRYKNKANQATGIPMDCSNSPDGKLQPSLENFYDSMSSNIKKRVTYSPNLEYLLNQGIMLLNSDLTCKLNKTSSHEKLWESFQKYFLEEVLSGFTGIIYVLSGKASLNMEKYINPLGNYIIKTEHPAAASHKHTEWDCKDVFTTINKILKANNGEESQILWDKRDWDADNEPPF